MFFRKLGCESKKITTVHRSRGEALEAVFEQLRHFRFFLILLSCESSELEITAAVKARNWARGAGKAENCARGGRKAGKLASGVVEIGTLAICLIVLVS